MRGSCAAQVYRDARGIAKNISMETPSKRRNTVRIKVEAQSHSRDKTHPRRAIIVVLPENELNGNTCFLSEVPTFNTVVLGLPPAMLDLLGAED